MEKVYMNVIVDIENVGSLLNRSDLYILKVVNHSEN